MKSPTILVARPDRVGDVILSTPAVEALRAHNPHSRIIFLVQEAVAPLLRGLSSVDEVMIFDPLGRHRGISGLFQLIQEFRALDVQIGVVLHSHWKIAAALYGAGVRYRVGPLSKIHSYLFYNRGVRQRRSRVEMHEADYNLELLRRLGVRAQTRSVLTRVSISDEARAWARHWLATQGLGEDEEGHSRTPLIAVHPGMGGSALNWPEDHFAELIQALSHAGYRVLVTSGPLEASLMERLKARLRGLPVAPIFYGGEQIGTIDRLGALLLHASVVVAPSTGPLHLAVALGRPTVSFFPPVRVQSAIRWGPYVAAEQSASVLVPDVYCGQDFECLLDRCRYFPCMKSLGVAQALEQVKIQLNRSPEGTR